ncbi:hypothetical protein [Nocardioides humi]|uniref:Uncharacterized protein n=1 Tax=Nocardioides humi TaxID=449461 RepID=A0ABN2AYY4_9ACTN|nr:hypothetical protein [Nocardioides humi]
MAGPREVKRSERPAVVAVLVVWLAVLGPLVAGCGVVGRPDADGWDEQAEQALADAASQVATARLALETAAEGRTWSSYTTVLMADAEEAAGRAEDDLARVQAPARRTGAARAVLDLLARAVELVRTARAHVVAGRYDDPALLDDLDRIAGELERASP